MNSKIVIADLTREVAMFEISQTKAMAQFQRYFLLNQEQCLRDLCTYFKREINLQKKYHKKLTRYYNRTKKEMVASNNNILISVSKVMKLIVGLIPFYQYSLLSHRYDRNDARDYYISCCEEKIEWFNGLIQHFDRAFSDLENSLQTYVDELDELGDVLIPLYNQILYLMKESYQVEIKQVENKFLD